MKILPEHIHISEYDYPLPQHRIAEHPVAQRDTSKLLVYKSGKIKDDTFNHLSEHLPAQSTLIVNNTKVIESRMLFQKPTGGIIEIFCLEPHGITMEYAMQQQGTGLWNCLIGSASKWKPGQLLHKQVMIHSVDISITARYIEKLTDSFVIQFSWQPEIVDFATILHAAGAIPLPPYIKRTATESDAERYQTVFAHHPGSVAAPTAALHFTKPLFERLAEKNISLSSVTLHVGAGTFKPVKTATIAQHPMHAEQFTVSTTLLKTLLGAKQVVAVGTTSLRTLESLHWLGVKLLTRPSLSIDELQLHQWEAYELEQHGITYQESLRALLEKTEQRQLTQLHGETSLLIVPGYTFQLPSGLITNFHQPQSTLVLLVAAFIGEDWRKIYDYALQHEYRFLSYGDSSLLWCPLSPNRGT